MSKIDLDITNLPDTTVNVREAFGIDVDLEGLDGGGHGVPS